MKVGGLKVAGAPATRYAFTKIADTTDHSFLTGINCAGMNNLGNVIVAAAGQLWIGDGQALGFTSIAQDVQTLCASINDLNETAYGTRLPNNARALVRNNNGVLTTLAASSGSPSYEPTTNNPLPSLSNSGSAVYYSTGTPGSGFGAGIYIGPVLTTVYNSATDSSLSGFFQPVSMNDSHVVVFRATRSTPSGLLAGIYRGSSVPLIESGQTVSGGVVSISSAFRPVINNWGRVAFVGSVGGVWGVYTTVDGSAVDLVGTDPFDRISINDSGAVAFRRAHQIGSGIFVGRPGSINEKVIDFGDPIDGSTLSDASVWEEAINNKGQIAFWARLEDGRSGVYRADPIDETAPVVTPPAPIGVSATMPAGATGNASQQLAGFLAAGTATDDVDPNPVPLMPQFNGADATNDTLFPVGTSTITFRFRDASNNIGTANSTVTVSPYNLPPIAVDGTLNVAAGSSVSGTLVVNDPDGPVLSYSIVSNGTKGTATLTNAATGAYTYTANVGTSGADSFSFKANDGLLDSNIATITVTITSPSQAPVARTGVLITSSGTPADGTLQGSDTDSGALTFTLTGSAGLGTVDLVNAATGAFRYTPNPGVTGYDTFTFAVSDGQFSAAGMQMVFIVAESPQWPGQVARMSVAGDGVQANHDNADPSVSADGRLVAFQSFASNLVAGDTNGAADAFVHDRQTGQTTRVSISSTGEQGNGASFWQRLSADGRFVAFQSAASNLVVGDTNGTSDVFVRNLQTGHTTRVSVANDGTQGNNISVRPALSADGRFVAFQSSASNLVGGDNNGLSDVFVHDRQTGQTTRVSIASDGAQGNNNSLWPAVSADGRFVSFYSVASNLVGGDSNGAEDVFVRDRLTSQTSRVSVATGGIQANNGSYTGTLSADGRFVAFISEASNLVANDTNGVDDVFVHDRLTGQTMRAGVADNGAQANAQSIEPALSADGRFVAFASLASNLTSGDTNGRYDAFVRDQLTNRTVRVSLAGNGAQANHASESPVLSADGRYVVFDSSASNLVNGDTNAFSDVFVVGAASVPVAENSTLTTLEDTPGTGTLSANDPAGQSLTYTLVNTGTLGTAALTNAATGAYTYTPNANSHGSDTFTFKVNNGLADSNIATVTVTITPVNDPPEIVGPDRAATLEDVSVEVRPADNDVDADGPIGQFAISSVTQPSNGTVTQPGTHTLVYTPVPNFNGGDAFTYTITDTGGQSKTGTVQVSVLAVNDHPIALNGTLGVSAGGLGNGTLMAMDIDSAALTYELIANGAKGTAIITNAATGAYTYTANAGASGGDTFTFRANDGVMDSNIATITVTIVNQAPMTRSGVLTTAQDTAAEGRLQAVDPESSALTFSLTGTPRLGTVQLLDAAAGTFRYTPNPGVTGYDVFPFEVSDGQLSTAGTQMVFIVSGSPRWPGQTVRASVNSGGSQGPGGFRSVTSANGRYVAFTTPNRDILVHDRHTLNTVVASQSNTGELPDRQGGDDPAISADGRFVAFDSASTNLVSGDTNGAVDVFVRDLLTSQTTRVSVANDGTQANGVSHRPAISADGRYVAFVSRATNLVPTDTNPLEDVLVYDRLTSKIQHVSKGLGGTAANSLLRCSGDADGSRPCVSISANGRYIAFSSFASNLVPDDTNVQPDSFVADLWSGTTTRVSVSSGGGQSTHGGTDPALSADGRYVVFVSVSSNLVAGDTNDANDVFLHDRLTSITSRVSIADNEGQALGGDAVLASVSADGRYVAFTSFASNLVDDDTNGERDVFVRDVVSGRTVRVNVTTEGDPGNNRPRGAPEITADGQFIAFWSDATNLVLNDTNSFSDVFVVGGVSVTPSTVDLSRNGGEVVVNVGFTYPGTPWPSESSVEWATAASAGGTGNGSVTFTVDPNPGPARQTTLFVATQPIVVNQAGNTAPLAVNDAASTPEDASVLIPVKDNDTDADGDTIAAGSLVQPQHGAVVFEGGAVRYTPVPDFHGIDTFGYRVVDSLGGESNTATVTIAVTPVNDAPVAQNTNITSTEATSFNGSLSAADVDGDSLSFTIVSNPSLGTVVITDTLTGAFTYTPNAGVFGSDAFQFKTTDSLTDSNIATVTVAVLAPVPGISPGAMEFGNQLRGTTSTGQIAALSNRGNTPLILHGIAVSGQNPIDFRQSTTCPTSLPPGDTCNITITFTPTVTGLRSALLEVVTNSVTTPKSVVALFGTGTAPIVSLSVTGLNFGNQNVGNSSAAQLVTLTNTGTGPLFPSGQSITGAHGADFSFSSDNNTCIGSIAPGGNCTISISFTPTNTGTRTASLLVMNNASDSPQAIALTGTGRPGLLSLTPNPVTFAVQTLGTASNVQTAVLKNTGTTDVNITSILGGGDFAVAGTTCGGTLAGGASCSVSITFRPIAGGVRSGLLAVGSSSGNVTTVLFGIGTIVSLAPPSLNYGNQNVGTDSAPQTATLRNMSTGTTLGISGIAIAGNAGADYKITATTCGTSLAPGASCIVEVTFNPTKKGSRKASLAVTHDADGNVHLVSLDGSGK